MFSLMLAVVATWRALGIPTYPVQASAVISHGPEGYRIDPRIFSAALNAGLVPLVTGDLLLEGPVNIYSSDCVPELLAEHFSISHVGMLTDVAGYLDRSGPEDRLVASIHPGHASSLAGAKASAKTDVTGGMRTKVDALMRLLLQAGIESTIADGRVSGNFFSLLVGREVVGTAFRRSPA